MMTQTLFFSGAVTPESSIFWYLSGLSNENFTQDNYVPTYLDDLSDADIAQVNSTCRDNKFCQYDSVVLGSDILGAKTKQQYDDIKEKEKIKGTAKYI